MPRARRSRETIPSTRAVDGSRALKDAIVVKLKRDNRLAYTPEQVLVSNGAKQSCYNACLALLDPGDEVIIPAPYWVSYPDMVRLADAEPVIVQAPAERGFRISPEQLRAAITPKTRLVMFNSPCNPTGGVYTRADWIALGAVLREHPRVTILTRRHLRAHLLGGRTVHKLRARRARSSTTGRSP